MSSTPLCHKYKISWTKKNCSLIINELWKEEKLVKEVKKKVKFVKEVNTMNMSFTNRLQQKDKEVDVKAIQQKRRYIKISMRD
ncbi:hypothetical protein RIR_jg1632.t1 [Rhizophagus irregularis DAOM 181602=DAOM 197198]|nr:hypothetical protein RIR_jg1632.t1 [Rhizophagus irregularis DAOM 181602=DAOM 197198]